MNAPRREKNTVEEQQAMRAKFPDVTEDQWHMLERFSYLAYRTWASKPEATWNEVMSRWRREENDVRFLGPCGWPRV